MERRAQGMAIGYTRGEPFARGDVIGGLIWGDGNRPRWWQRLRGVAVLCVLAASVITSGWEWPWAAAATIVLTVLAVAGRVPAVFNVRSPALRVAGLVVTGLAGLGLSYVAPSSGALAFVALVIINVTEYVSPTAFSAVAVVTAVAYVIGQLALGRGPVTVSVGPAVIVAAVLLGLVRRQTRGLAAEAALTREEQARSAALDERARIAREIHDVLAHSLAALTVQLETADALLESGRAEKARESVVRAGKLAREGLAETRRAIGALRGDLPPLPDLVAGIVAAYGADFPVAATLDVTGQVRELRPDVALAIYRTAQEAVTNIRKHAPGAEVAATIEYAPAEVTMTVTNGPAPGGAGPLSSTGGGYGLTGLRERAELAGGTISAGPVATVSPSLPQQSHNPHEGGWRVSARIPA